MIDYSYLTLNGSYQINEDSVGFVNNGNRQCFILADGLGGHGEGDVASKTAVDFAKNYFSTCSDINENVIADCFSGIHDKLLSMQISEHTIRGIKTTLVALIIENDVAYWAHVGDSRLYRFSRFAIKEQTKDHSVPQMMVVMGEITPEQIRENPDRNKLLRALGMEGEAPKAEIHYPGTPVKKGDGFLLCSDGFWELILEKDMKKSYIFSSTSSDWLGKMKNMVEKNGKNKKMDNYSAIAIKIV